MSIQYKTQPQSVVKMINEWVVNNVPAAAAQATITKAAAGTDIRHVCQCIAVTIACGTTAQTPIQIYLRDGASGTGAILWAATVAAPANGVGGVIEADINIKGSPNTAMTLEFSGAGVSDSRQVVTLSGFDIQQS